MNISTKADRVKLEIRLAGKLFKTKHENEHREEIERYHNDIGQQSMHEMIVDHLRLLLKCGDQRY
jgi:hypothetical protein